MRDTIGERPYEVEKKADGKFHITLYPQTKDAKHPDAVLFRFALAKDDLKKLARLAS